jgi:hypothetical protein
MGSRRAIYHRYQIAASIDRGKITKSSIQSKYQPKKYIVCFRRNCISYLNKYLPPNT